MLNFREELNKIKQEKLKCNEEVKEKAETLLKSVLNAFKAKETEQFLEEVEVMFMSMEERVYVKENPRIPYKTKQVGQTITLDNSEMALKVLCYLEDKLKHEGFEIASIERASTDRRFSIKISV